MTTMQKILLLLSILVTSVPSLRSFTPGYHSPTRYNHYLLAAKKTSGAQPLRRSWDENYALLVEFHKQHGHTNVPGNDEYRKLFNWTAKQRERQDVMRRSRYVKLDALNFDWRSDKKWERMFLSLKEFQEEHGHCNVEPSSTTMKNLAVWISAQEFFFSLGQLQPERIEKLNAIGFWDTWNKGLQGKDHKWKIKFDELVQFKKIHGHCNVLASKYPEYKSLAKWVSQQRNMYSSGKLAPEWKEKLESIGFIWKLRERWTKRFKDLVEFKEVHGHFNIPQSDPEYKSLNKWANSQKFLFRKGNLRPDRIEKLESIGFL